MGTTGTPTLTTTINGKIQGTMGQRAATLFDPPDPRPDPPPPASTVLPVAATAESPVPVPVPSAEPGIRVGLAERLRAFRGWLYVRCGIEFRTAAALLVVLAVAVGFAVQHFWTGRPRTVSAPARIDGPSPGASLIPSRGPGPRPAAGSGPEAQSAVAGAKTVLTVDVAGKARHPGVRRLPAGSRVADALAAAGGALPGTDTSALNLARVLADGEQVVVGGPSAPAAPGPAAAHPPDP